MNDSVNNLIDSVDPVNSVDNNSISIPIDDNTIVRISVDDDNLYISIDNDKITIAIKNKPDKLIDFIKNNINNIFGQACKQNNKRIAEWLYDLKKELIPDNNTVDILENGNILFCIVCANGYKDIAEWLYYLSKTHEKQKINIHVDNDYPFRYSCQYGHKDTAEWLYSISKIDDNTKINIHILDEYPFRAACYYGHKHVAEWLYWLSENDDNEDELINIHADDNFSFRTACQHGHKKLAEWLCGFDETFAIDYKGDTLIAWIRNVKTVLEKNDVQYIAKLVEKSKNIKQREDTCMICLHNDANYWIKLDCRHEVCADCFQFIEKCPMRCKNDINLRQVDLMINMYGNLMINDKCLINNCNNEILVPL